jgi:hypothetical protein
LQHHAIQREPDISEEHNTSTFRVSACHLLDLIYDSKDEGKMFLQNVGLPPYYNVTTQKILLFMFTLDLT